jgi:hypothetical protein
VAERATVDVMRVVLATIVAVALTAIPTSIASRSSSGLEGKVLRGPISPVCLVTRPCQAATSVLLAFSRQGTVVAEVRSAPTGEYRISLAPGVYSVAPAHRVPLWRLYPQTVRVTAGIYRRVNFLIDTGIR